MKILTTDHSQRKYTAALLFAAKCGMVGLLVSWAALHSQTASATIGYGDRGELFVSVFDDTAKVSYTLDLGIPMSEFLVSAQQDAGVQLFWTLEDANFANFLTRVDAGNLRWAVMAFDNSGPLVTPFAQGMFSTVRSGTSLTTLLSPTNLNLSNGIGVGQAGNFINALNQANGDASNTHLTQANGSNVNAISDPGITYFGEPQGTGPSLNGNFVTLRLDNPVGTSSWFYYFGRNGSTNTSQKIVFDEFDNGQVSPNNGNDGYFGLVYVDPTLYPSSPYLGKYLLSYTLEPIRFFAQTGFAASIGRTEFDGSFAVTRLEGVAAASAETSAANSITRLPGLADMGGAVTVVPEPGTWALMGAGLALLLAARRQRR